MLNLKPGFSLSSFTFIKRLFRFYSLSAIRVVSSAYLRLLIFLPAILISACVSSSLAFYMMYSAFKLNKQGDNIQPWRTPLPIWYQSVVPCPVLTCFLTCIQISQEAGQVIWHPISFRIFHSLLWSTQSKVLVYSIRQKQMFFWNSLAFSMTQQMLAIWSLVPLPFLNPAWTSGSSQFMYCWSSFGEFWALLC